MDPTPQPLELVLTTEADRQRAEALARTLLERRLVACAALSEIRSLYRWQGELQCGEEVQLLLKTTPERLEALRMAVHELHSYELPEWIHWRASSEGGYGRWCAAELEPIREGGGGPAPAESPAAWDPAG